LRLKEQARTSSVGSRLGHYWKTRFQQEGKKKKKSPAKNLNPRKEI
jgi:hypothetical protein